MAWRSRYNPAMEEVRSGRRPFVVLDTLHREMLEATLVQFDIEPATLGEQVLAELTLAWHRLDPWPDAPDGLARLRSRFPVVALSNGNVALMVGLSRHGGLTWDAILGAEHARAYKPDPAVYLRTAEALALAPGELCLVAAHHADLAAARACGLATAFVARPDEYGGRPAPDRDMGQEWEYTATQLHRPRRPARLLSQWAVSARTPRSQVPHGGRTARRNRCPARPRAGGPSRS